jgi:predicted RNase H-like HicB family nuclease
MHAESDETKMPVMAQASVEYVYVVERAEDGGYWAYVPDLPGCATTAEQLEYVPKIIAEAVGLYLSYYRDRQLPLPVPEARMGIVKA